MFEQVCGFRIEGGFFKKTACIKPFNRVKDDNSLGAPIVYSIIYGANGSGKSSISQALYEYSTGLQEFSSVELIDQNKKVIPLIDVEVKKKIFVFSERFINEHVRFAEDKEKLNAIVLLGEQKTLDDQIQIIGEQALKLKNETLPKSEASKIQAELDLQKIKNLIVRNLRENWAERERLIKNSRTAAPVKEANIGNYLNLIPTMEETFEELQQKYKIGMNTLLQIREKKVITEQIATISVDCDIDLKIKKLLSRIIEKPILNEREQQVMSLLETYHGSEKIKEAQEYFSHEVEYCPFCLQAVTQTYKIELLKAIEHVFDSEAAKSHRAEIEQFKLTFRKYENNFDVFKDFFPDQVKAIEEKIEQYNIQIDIVLQKLNKKSGDIYTPILEYNSNILSYQKDLFLLINNLDIKCKQYNKFANQESLIIKKLQHINKKLAYFENKENYFLFLQKNENLDKLKIELSKYQDKYLYLNQKIQKLNAEKSNIILAIEIINKYLSYIFFSEDRLQVAIDNDKYIVTVFGDRVPLLKLSEGEKNAIALCYFFTILLTGKEKINFFKEELFIVLDDPISSFDYINKVGIFSYLRLMIAKIARNKSSRILILTHQIESVFHLEKIADDVSPKLNLKTFTLTQQKLIPFSHNKENEYSNLLKDIYMYANQSPGYEMLDHTVGNTMRRVLEAFSTFCYKKSIEKITRDKEVLEKLPEKLREHYENLMYRIILNSESHLSYQVRAIPEYDFYNLISREERIRTAKEILYLIYKLNDLHIKAHLDSDCVNKICSWEVVLFPTIA